MNTLPLPSATSLVKRANTIKGEVTLEAKREEVKEQREGSKVERNCFYSDMFDFWTEFLRFFSDGNKMKRQVTLTLFLPLT